MLFMLAHCLVDATQPKVPRHLSTCEIRLYQHTAHAADKPFLVSTHKAPRAISESVNNYLLVCLLDWWLENGVFQCSCQGSKQSVVWDKCV